MAPKAEKRTSPDDGYKYTLKEFKEYFGDKKGTQKWEKAGAKPATSGKPCSVCGKTNHLRADCKHKDKECSNCNKVGHLASVCRQPGGGAVGGSGGDKSKPGAKPAAERKPRKPRVDSELLEAALVAAKAAPAKTLQLKAPLDEGMPGPEHFQISEAPVADVPEGGLLLEVLYASADPYLRSRIKSTAVKKEDCPSPMNVFVCGRVLESKSPNWHPGDFLGGSRPLTTVQVLTEDHLKTVWRLTGLVDESTASWGIGVLGMPGATAWGGFHEICKPKRAKKKGEPTGETIFVSAASGAVGQLVGQLAKFHGCTTIGSAGGPEKCATLKEKFGYDHAIDYKTCADADALKAKLKDCAPDGIDMYFENVGGMHFDAALASLKPGGRIAVCGCISQYNSGGTAAGGLGGNTNGVSLGSLIYPQIRIEGFVCARWLFGGKGNYRRDMVRHMKQDKMQVTETKTEGIENWAKAFQTLFTGANNGKVAVKVADRQSLQKPEAEKEESKGRKGVLGGTGEEQDADADVQKICDDLKDEIGTQAQAKGWNGLISSVKAEKFKTQRVAGKNFFVKAKINDSTYFHLRIFQPLAHTGESPSLHSIDIEKGDAPVEYF